MEHFPQWFVEYAHINQGKFLKFTLKDVTHSNLSNASFIYLPWVAKKVTTAWIISISFASTITVEFYLTFREFIPSSKDCDEVGGLDTSLSPKLVKLCIAKKMLFDDWKSS